MDSSLTLCNSRNLAILLSVSGLAVLFLGSGFAIHQRFCQLLARPWCLFIQLNPYGLYGRRPALNSLHRIVTAVIKPIYSFFILWLSLNIYNAATTATFHGLIYAVTFVTVSSVLSQVNVDVGRQMSMPLALIESLKVIAGLLSVSFTDTDVAVLGYRPVSKGETCHGNYAATAQPSFYEWTVC